MTEGLIFEDLPPKRGPGATARRPTAPWILALKARPGEWARLPLKASTTNPIYKKHGIEFARRTVDGEKRIYGRYIGNGSA